MDEFVIEGGVPLHGEIAPAAIRTPRFRFWRPAS